MNRQTERQVTPDVQRFHDFIPKRSFHRQVSLTDWAAVPTVIDLLGSDSQVTAPLYLRIYLYCTVVDAGRFTVTTKA
jgi:hypothetical protein